ncbi:DUF6113 family protein [Streptomyces sp. TRM 70351]|uniref:DUF6113 family protein n=1 Tax=Streptomyces sp. TRM 70351 TaxID=3116552 RepID=UPI002E7AE812|nr:DUF6113 family protein [Streptomyces sp. TRM 70351]MEE1927737.1 DUF6113 family protein [Streptomyces sp. TRM 70351]
MNTARLAAHTGLAVLGAAAGAAGTLVHAAWAPGGVLLALAGTAAVCVGGALATGTRAGAAVPAVAWTLSVLVLLLWARPEGDFLFGTGVSSYAYLYGGMILAVICATVAPPGRAGFGRPGDLAGRPQ